jgi:hypothetical protein
MSYRLSYMRIYLAKISLLLLFITQFTQYAYASGVRISWVENSESDVAGYRVYYGTTSHNYQRWVDAGPFTSVEIDDLSSGYIYFFAVTAYNNSGNESAYSREIQATIPTISKNDGGGSSGGCFISNFVSENSASQGLTFLVLAGMVLIGFTSLFRRDISN